MKTRLSVRALATFLVAVVIIPGDPAWAADLNIGGPFDVRVDGLLDLRLVHPSDQNSFLDGGLGKLETGNGTPTAVRPYLGIAALRGIIGLMPDLHFITDIRYDSHQNTAVDILDAYMRYRPVSLTRWRWGVRAGAFFAPISLENTGVAWTTEWTLTPSAINTWVGDELRTLGGEASMEWRGDVDHFVAAAAVFARNDPAGVALADQGWTLSGHTLGLLGALELPQVVAQQRAKPGVPVGDLYASEFRELDGIPGWYAGLSWDRPDLGRVALLYYDNEADPSAHDSSEFAWRTKFWSLGLSTELAGIVILAQGMVGSTAIEPFAGFVATTDFYGAYVLLGYEIGKWRAALRLDQFGTTERQPGPGPRTSEHGHAATVALTWTANDHIKITGEVLAVDSWRVQRLLENRPPRAVEMQAQLSLRLSF